MKSFVGRVVVNAIAIWVATALVPGVVADGQDTPDLVLTFLLVGLVFGVVNALLGPLLRVLTFPLFVVTLGLFTFVVNALLLWLTSWVSAQLGLAFAVDGFVAALLGSLVVTIVSLVLNSAARRG